MNKKTILIAIVAVIAVLISYKIIRGVIRPTNEIWNNNKITASYPKDSINEVKPQMPQNAVLYIDASQSMQPYFKADGTNLKNTLSCLANIHNDSLKVFLIGKQNPFNGLMRDIVNKIKNQVNLPTTEFHSFFKDAAHIANNSDTIIYYLTDGIMSIGNTNMDGALVQLQGKITNSLKEFDNIAGVILRYEGDFIGDYWNQNNTRLDSITCPILKNQITRPYYIIAIGNKEAIKWLETRNRTELNNPDALYMGLHDLDGHNKAKLTYSTGVLEDMNKDITLHLELPECIMNIDPNNIILTNNGNIINSSITVNNTITPEPITRNGKVIIAKISYLQPLTSESDGSIIIRMSAPNTFDKKWLNWSTDSDVKGPDTISTYGLKYLLEGMYNGLEKKNDNNNIHFFSADFKYKLK